MAASWFSCLCLWRSPERAPLLDVRPSNVFPPPHTVLTAPVPRVRPLAQLASLLRRPLGLEELAASAHRSYDSRHCHNAALGSPHSSDTSSRPLSILEYAERRRDERRESYKKDDERREADRVRQKNISTAYGSLMCKVDRHSLPPTPTFVDEAYRRHSSSSSTEQLHSHLDAYAIPVPTHSHAYSSPQNYGSIGLGICSSIDPMARTYIPKLATPPSGFSSRRPPPAPGLIVTPAGPASFPASFTHHPSIIPPLSPCKPAPLTPITPPALDCPETPEVPEERPAGRGRGFSRHTFWRPSITRISSRDSSMTCGTLSTGPSRSTSMSREVLSESEANVVYKEIGLAGLATVGPACTTPTRRRRFKHRKRGRISWVDEKDDVHMPVAMPVSAVV